MSSRETMLISLYKNLFVQMFHMYLGFRDGDDTFVRTAEAKACLLVSSARNFELITEEHRSGILDGIKKLKNEFMEEFRNE